MRSQSASEPTLAGPSEFYDAYLLDLDGTIYLGDEVLPGAKELLQRLTAEGKKRIFLSNNPTKDPLMYLQKLTRLGIEAELSEILNTVVSTTDWLVSNRSGKKVFAISDEPLKKALQAADIELTEDPAEIDIVIASYDHSFDYRKLQIAFDALWQHGNAELITTNPDRYCPLPGGRGEPDAAGTLAAIEATTGVKCQYNMGKPDQIMIDVAMGRLGPNVKSVIMIGDRLSTDVRMAINAGIDSALVLTGDSKLGEVENLLPQLRPTYTLESIYSLIPK